MIMSNKIVLLLLTVTAFAIISLSAGAPYIVLMLPGGLPLGNALTAAGLCSAAGAALALSSPDSLVRLISRAALIAAAVWLPVSIALAGNPALNFHDSRGTVWMAISLITVLLAFGALTWALIRALLAAGRAANAG